MQFAAVHESASGRNANIARSRMDVRFRGKNGRAADITGTTEFDPNPTSV
jgi:hypothetical protein